jgi:hypothetical protein
MLEVGSISEQKFAITKEPIIIEISNEEIFKKRRKKDNGISLEDFKKRKKGIFLSLEDLKKSLES